MAEMVVNGAMMMCSGGVAPGTLIVPPAVVKATSPAATIMDMKPTNFGAGFAMCKSMTNPAVSAATSAAQGVLTPQPCSVLALGPWSPGASKVKVGKLSALTKADTCKCWGETITIKMPGQVIAKAK
jgi:hypothetical protein